MQTYHCHHLAQSTHPSWPIFHMGRLRLREAVGFAPGRRGYTRTQAFGLQLFWLTSFRVGEVTCAKCVSGSMLAILNIISSCLIPWPPGEADIFNPTSWRTKVRLRGESSQDLNPGARAFKAHAISWCKINYNLIIEETVL